MIGIDRLSRATLNFVVSSTLGSRGYLAHVHLVDSIHMPRRGHHASIRFDP
jgi:hypothetical protein